METVRRAHLYAPSFLFVVANGSVSGPSRHIEAVRREAKAAGRFRTLCVQDRVDVEREVSRRSDPLQLPIRRRWGLVSASSAAGIGHAYHSFQGSGANGSLLHRGRSKSVLKGCQRRYQFTTHLSLLPICRQSDG